MQKKKPLNGNYEATVSAGTKTMNCNITIPVKDNTIAILQKLADKISQLLFTTKPTRRGNRFRNITEL